MDFLPDTDVSVRVMFEGLGQPKVPDTGTVSWTLRGDAGDIVLVDQPLSPGPASSSVIVTVPAVQNAIVARYEKRTLITKFSSGGIPYTVSMRYRLVPFLNLEIGPENVRKRVEALGKRADGKQEQIMVAPLTDKITLISKPSGLHVPPWQMVSSLLNTAQIANTPDAKSQSNAAERAATCTTDGETRSNNSMLARSASDSGPRWSTVRATVLVQGL